MHQSIITIVAMCLFCSVSFAGVTSASVHVRHKHVHRHRIARPIAGTTEYHSIRHHHRSVVTHTP